jgi:uncharacterized protein YkwD
MLLVGLAGRMPLSAGSVPASDYRMGAYSPDAQVENLVDSESPLFSLAEDLAGDCEWASTNEQEMVCLINQARRDAGLAPVKSSPILTAAAESHSIYMRDSGCFGHQCPGELSTPDRVCTTGYDTYCWGVCYVGETIAAGYSTAGSVVAAWMGSQPHRDILLHGKLREIGVGYASGGYYGYYWTATFGSQPDVLPIFINYEDPETASREVTLTLNNERVSGCSGIDYADEVMISNEPDFVGAGWKPYTLHKLWMLSEGNGDKTVFIKYRDATGYEVNSDDTILLDEPLKYKLQLGSDSLTFLYEIGSGFRDPAPVSVSVDNAAGSSPMTWSAEYGEAAWPDISPVSGTTPDSLTVSVDGFEASGVSTYQGAVIVTSPQDPENPQEMPVTILAVEKVYRVMLPRAGVRGN